MKVICHRGFWKDPDERNSVSAFARSLHYEFGLETDIRDHNGRLVISHDVPVGEGLAFDSLLRLFRNSDLPLALNIKADGLAGLVKRAITAYNIKDWFVFDMSIPDMRNCLDEKLPVFARVSDVESNPPWIGEVSGIWLDSFDGGHYDAKKVAEYLDAGKRVCLVSPELHKRPYEAVWRDIKTLSDLKGLMICTDYPERATRYFETAIE